MIRLDDAGNENERLALRLFKSMEDGNIPETLAEICTADFSWANSGLPTLQGRQAVLDLLGSGGFSCEIPILKTMTHFTADLIHIASRGDTVFTERVDHHWDAEGRDLMTPHIAGVVEIRDGKIVRLHDFYDIACYEQVPTEPDSRFALPKQRA